jgi:hypothetical protein
MPAQRNGRAFFTGPQTQFHFSQKTANSVWYRAVGSEPLAWSVCLELAIELERPAGHPDLAASPLWITRQRPQVAGLMGQSARTRS